MLKQSEIYYRQHKLNAMQFVPCRLGSFRKFLPIPRTIAASHSNFRYAPGMQLVEKFHCAAQPTILRSYFKPILSVKQFTSIDAEHAVSYEELKALIEARDVLLIDVRDPEEIEAQGRIIGAVNVPLGQLPEAFEMTEESFFKKYNFEKPHMYDANVVFHGLSHIKSTAAVEIAHKHGFTKQVSPVKQVEVAYFQPV
ncbi:Rhodanese domain containing protein [Trichuris trichiura]|uniref:Rhodanese domain containing protein n=1 Tax=Trichuris trichiura TaxID=36087 RepID=A0A077Z538_TRITR|nr:Rhodanese domain containing protein [Trichuris trichiura]